jgi:hypothetical protein
MIKRSTITSLGPIVLLVAFGAAPPEADAGERWLWSITPYMWASDISEDLILRGEVVGGGDTEFKDLLDVVDSSLQLHFEGIQDRWGLFADLTYIDLSDSETGELELLRFDVEITETLFEAGALYRPGGRSGRLDLLFGARLLAVDEVYRLQLGERDPIETRSVGWSRCGAISVSAVPTSCGPPRDWWVGPSEPSETAPSSSGIATVT